MTMVSEAWDDLEAFLASDDEEPPPEVEWEPPRPPTDDVAVDRMLRKIGRLKRQEEAIRTVVDSERDRLARWQGDRLAGIHRTLDWLAASLENYTRATLGRTSVRSIRLPNGTLALRKPGNPKLVEVPKADPEDVSGAQWVHGLHPRFVRVSYHLDADAVKRECAPGPPLDSPAVVAEPGYTACSVVVEATGEIIEGMIFMVRDTDHFSLKVES